MEHAYVHLLHLLGAHAQWTLAVVFAAAFLESVAVIGTVVPGSTTMFLAGALVGTGSLNLGWLLACALAGAVGGDGLSYWLGHRYRFAMANCWPLRRHPQILAAGQQFFARHGARSVVFARFIAPVRAIVPVVAGMAGMRPARFYAMNVLSALLWAPAHILPGIVFGTSLQLAGAVSFRLVAVIAILAALGWLSYRLMHALLARAHAWAVVSHQRLLSWAQRHRGRPATLVAHALDPAHPAAGTIVVISALVLLSAWLFFSVFEGVANGEPVVQIDLSVYRFLRSVRSPWADALFASLAALGSVPTLTALIATVVLWMTYERRWQTVAYWLAAAAFSQFLILAIQLTVRHAPPVSAGASVFGFPSNDVAASAIVYGFLAFLLVRRVGTLQGIAVATFGTAIVAAVALAGLYFGRYAFSDALGGAAFAAIWIAVVALVAVWRHPQLPPRRAFMPAIVAGVLGASVSAQWMFAPTPTAGPSSRPPTLISKAQWTDTVWRTFACYRSDMAGERREPITVQWSASRTQIEAQLRARGWIEGPLLSARSLLSLVAPNPAATALPVLPRLDNGTPSVLVFMRERTARGERDVLRFWPTPYALRRPHGAPAAPVWLGSLVHERIVRPSWPFNVLRPDRRVDPLIAAPGQADAWRALDVSRRSGCEGLPVMLIDSNVE
jgi:membrane protein DedA with SNARE-associated domain